MKEVQVLRQPPETRRRLLAWPSHLQVDGIERAGRAQEADLMSLPLAARLVEIASAPGDHILDPFGGIATIGVAANKMGRGFTGCEIDPARHAVGQSHLSAKSVWFKGSLAAYDTSGLTTDALITSPPFGRKESDHRAFDHRYYDEMRSIFSRASGTVRDGGVAVVELMNWPEFAGGEDLVFRFFQFMTEDWSYIRELVFTSPDQSNISSIASHTWITIWMKKPRNQDINEIKEIPAVLTRTNT